MIDWTKPVRRISDGAPLRVLCTDNVGNYPVICVTEDGRVCASTLDGRFWVTLKEVHIENIPPKKVQHTTWTAVYRDQRGYVKICGFGCSENVARELITDPHKPWTHVAKVIIETEE